MLYVTYMSLKHQRLAPWSGKPRRPNSNVATRRSKPSRLQGASKHQDKGIANATPGSPMPAPQCNSPQVNNTNVLATCASATHVTGMKLSQDPTLPMTSHHRPVEEAMLFKLQCVQRVLAVGSSGRVYIARYTFLPTVHTSV